MSLRLIVLISALAAIQFSFAAGQKASVLATVSCFHHTDPNDDADMLLKFTANSLGAEDIVTTEIQVGTTINNDANWFRIFRGATQVAWSAKSVSIDSDDGTVSIQLRLPLPKESPAKPNGKLTFESHRHFDQFYCATK